MKRIIEKIFVSTLLAASFASCNKDEHKDYLEGGTNPVLTASVTTPDLPLSYANAANTAIKLAWTNPDYKFTTGVSSQDVNYLVEIDTTGSNFTSPKRKVIAVSRDLSLSITVADFNGYLLNDLQLTTAVSHSIDIRVKSSLINSSAIMYSNVLKYTVTPYAIPPKIDPPASGELYITGNALPSDWTNAPPVTQKFTKVSTTLFSITVPLIGNNSYTFLPTFGSWNDKYSIATKNDPSEIYGGDFQWQGNDILAPPASGNYKIEVDFQRGKFTVTKL